MICTEGLLGIAFDPRTYSIFISFYDLKLSFLFMAFFDLAAEAYKLVAAVPDGSFLHQTTSHSRL